MPKRVDQNQGAIVKALREKGLSVLILSSVGKGCPDIAVGFQGKTYLIEIKNCHLPLSKQKLTPAEKIFFDSWHGHVMLIRNVTEANEFADRLINEFTT